MKFYCTETVSNRLSKGKMYFGNIIAVPKGAPDPFKGGGPLRICVYDNTNAWMSFNVKVFVPADQFITRKYTAEGEPPVTITEAEALAVTINLFRELKEKHDALLAQVSQQKDDKNGGG